MANKVEKGTLTPDQFGMVIADESHCLKNNDAKVTQAALPFLKAATICICLTGTPATNRPVELYTQLSGILPQVCTVPLIIPSQTHIFSDILSQTHTF